MGLSLHVQWGLCPLRQDSCIHVRQACVDTLPVVIGSGYLHSGDLMKEPVPIPILEQNETNSSGSGMEMSGEEVFIPYQERHDIILQSPGSSLLLYFYSDTALEKAGFNISYW